ncbi:IS3 family transposase [Streptomyces sp. NPDC050564]|uniref:IS3 family transposase n=1 Tax=Streptomyces sp. NPDC050564 TaxID=3365631 RepID=UPI0037B65145
MAGPVNWSVGGTRPPRRRPKRPDAPGIVKTECIRGRVFATRAEANLALFEYIDGFYNSRRIQKRLGYLSPIEFEEKHYADQATAERTNLKPRQPALMGAAGSERLGAVAASG